ncbi:MAG TPA: sigma factor-like helix-turn-helix DNA-binding protein [Jatrophihabitantaceae bacterium]|nr:sigma factor-like helix-turn-helix DNA-binding protein [Jatrophihabitantaceae bacterium]
MSGAERGDERLVAALAAARRGDEQAFVQLWRETNPGLVRYLAVLAGDRADELAIRTWAELVGRLRRFRGDEAAWRRLLFSTARSCARRHGPAVRAAAPRTPAAGETIADALTRVALDLLAVLPEPQPEVVLLRTAGGLGVSDVARVLKLSEPTVRTAAHAGLARAGALAADGPSRSRIDHGEPVVDPPDWERTGFVAGLGTVENAFEDLLAGRSVGPGAPARTRLIASVLMALRAPASAAELRGCDAARAAYAREFASAPRHAIGVLRLGSRVAVGAAVATIGLSGTAFAAYNGLLPGPLQGAVPGWLRAPASAPAHSGASSSLPSAPATGPSSAAVPGAVTSTAVPAATTATPTMPATLPAEPATTPPGLANTPPGLVNTPPGSTRTPPGATKTPPGSTQTPPGATRTPPGSTRTPPGSSTKTPPSSTKTPPGSTKTPPGSSSTPGAPGSTNTAPGTTRTPPGSTRSPSATNTPPGSTRTPSATNTPPGTTKTPHSGAPQ